ncbi:rCG51674 [Rattus norvegicus]|uniref:RCG51674 n=1 Tax=Rattus norvegicus TaxID=10116 RepID=A6IZR1_RAT|nr:rCG51674 [Rattus norvegicus]
MLFIHGADFPSPGV